MNHNLRKYITEFTIGLTIHVDAVVRLQDLYKEGPPKSARPAHIYLVSRRPLISIDPISVTIRESTVSGIVQIQQGAYREEHDFSSRHTWGSGAIWQSEWPYDEFSISNSRGQVIAEGVVAHLSGQTTGVWPQAAKRHEVVYIGQAFGQNGERTAWDRLKNHETVQKILSETRRDQQVWLSIAAITDSNLYTEIDHRGANISEEEDSKHSSRVHDSLSSGSFLSRDAVSLAEAGLIRSFQPIYNDRLKHTFPAKKQVPLEVIRELDIQGLMVELQGHDVSAQYGNKSTPYKSVQFVGYSIHRDENRPDGWVLQASNNLPGLTIPGDME